MTPLLAAEFYKLRKRPACKALALTGVGIVAVFYLMLAVLMIQEFDTGSSVADVAELRDMTSLRNSPVFGYGITQLIASVLGIVLMALAVTSEFGWRTVLTGVTWTGERGRLLVARIVVVLAFLAAGVALGWLAAAAGSLAIGFADGGLDTGGLDLAFAGDVLTGWGRTWLTVAAYAMLAAALASLSRNVAVAIGVALVIRFLEPVGVQFIDLLPGWIASLQHLLIAPNVDAMLHANGTLEGANVPDRDLPPTWRAALYLLAFCIASGLVAILSFTRQDLDV
jgi:hypothetical protein